MKCTNITSQLTFNTTEFTVNTNFSKAYRCGYIVNYCFWGSFKDRGSKTYNLVSGLPRPMFTQRYILVGDIYEASPAIYNDSAYIEIRYDGALNIINNTGRIFKKDGLVFYTHTYFAETL